MENGLSQQDLLLNFVGKVVTVPGKNSIFVCRAFEPDFFITAGDLGSLDTDGFVPAWLVPEAKIAKAKAGPKAKSKAKDAAGPTMKVIQTETEFTYNYRSFFTHSLKTIIAVTSIVPNESVIGEEKVMLTRPPLPSLEPYGVGTVGPRPRINSSSGSRSGPSPTKVSFHPALTVSGSRENASTSTSSPFCGTSRATARTSACR